MRARAVLAVCTTVLGLSAAVAVAAPAGATAAPAVGRFHSVAPSRVLPATPVLSGGTTTFVVPSSLRAERATALLLNLTATGAAGAGFVTVFPAGGVPPTVSNLNYVRGQTVRNLTSVPVTASGTISLRTRGAAVTLSADLTGYVAAGTSRTDGQRVGSLDALGGFASVGPVRVLDTRVGRGARTPAPAARAVSVRVTGAAVPADASAVLVNLTAVTPAAAGYLTAFPTGIRRPTASNLNFPAGRTVSGLALVPIGDNGRISLHNGSGRPLQLLADVQGYVAGGSPTTAGAIGPLAPQRLLDTRPTPVAANAGRTVQVTGRGGVPLAGVAGVVLSLTAIAPTASGSLTTAGADAPLADLTFAAGATVAGMVIVRPDARGRVTVGNASAGRTQVLVDVVGYVAGAVAAVPPTTVSRYTSDPAAIAGKGDDSEGCKDGTSGATFVLLDVGAQSRTGPQLSAAHPGVALANATPTVRRTYAHLVADLTNYLQEFARCGDQQARIAIGTNTSGVFRGTNGYPAATRGADWANLVVDPLRRTAATTLDVVGANDVEAGFAGSAADAAAWTTSFLRATVADLVYNGSLDFCSDDYRTPMTCGAVRDEAGVTKTWTPAQYVALTYGLGPGRISVLPQIYYSVPSQAGQWRNLHVASGGKLTFEGTLTQYGTRNSAAAGFDGAQGWSALRHALSTLAAPPSLPVATDLVLT